MKPERGKRRSTGREGLAGTLLELIPLGTVDAMSLNIAAANIQAVIGLNVAVLPALPPPDHAFLPNRRQYDAAAIIKSLADRRGGAPFKLGLTECDLCLPILTYVYGESQLGGRAAVISLHRLRDNKQRLLYERTAKVAIHEVGHLLGLAHCRQADCLMRFSMQLAQLDQLPLHFCSACQYEAARRLAPGARQQGEDTLTSGTP